MELTSFKQAEEYLNQFIPQTSKWGEPAFAHKRTKHFMKLLGDPQNKVPVIHIAGTSGKGSTAYITSTLLHSQGFKVGMGISPHIYHILERIQINGEFVSEELFIKYLNQLVPFIEEMKSSEYGQLTYFEIIVGLSYYLFYHEKVEVVVMETGLGGQFDATNTVTSEDKISVITKIGYDHLEFLGDTLERIAFAKAKIIQKYNLVMKLDQETEVMEVIEKEGVAQNATLIKLNSDDVITSISSGLLGTRFDFSYKDILFKELHIPLIGEYQFENIGMAFTTFVEFIKRKKKTIDESRLRDALETIHIPGRMELVSYKDREFIIDGAHNPQKMEAFIQSLAHIYKNEKFTFLLSFKKGKDYQDILKHIIPHASFMILTSFENTNQGMGQLYSEDLTIIGDILEKMDFHAFQIIPDLKNALEFSLKTKEMIIITGSLYLIGEVYSIIEN